MNLDLINRFSNTNMQIIGDNCPYLIFKNWIDLPIFAGFTTKHGGVSKGEFSSLNLSFTRGDDKELVFENYHRITKSMGIDINSLICTNQTHTNEVRYVTRKNLDNFELGNTNISDVDGLITDDDRVTLVAYFADCVPVYVYDNKNHSVAMLHAGWKGTLTNIVGVGLEMLSDDRKNIKIAIGPSISVKNYEVEIEVAKEFLDKYDKNDAKKIIIKKNDEKYMLDMKMANKINALYMGVNEKNIIDANICTYDFNKDLFSHRYTQGKRGNMAGFIKLGI